MDVLMVNLGKEGTTVMRGSPRITPSSLEMVYIATHTIKKTLLMRLADKPVVTSTVKLCAFVHW